MPQIRGIPSALPNSGVDKLLLDRDSMLTVLGEQLGRAQQKMKSYADQHRHDLSFHITNLVYLKWCPYRLSSLARQVNEKLAPRFYGPFLVIQRIGQLADKLLYSSCFPHFSTSACYGVCTTNSSPTSPIIQRLGTLVGTCRSIRVSYDWKFNSS